MFEKPPIMFVLRCWSDPSGPFEHGSVSHLIFIIRLYKFDRPQQALEAPIMFVLSCWSDPTGLFEDESVSHLIRISRLYNFYRPQNV